MTPNLTRPPHSLSLCSHVPQILPQREGREGLHIEGSYEIVIVDEWVVYYMGISTVLDTLQDERVTVLSSN